MTILKKNLQIAIDGPVAAGKSIAAKLISQKLGILYVYTGAMYRAVALLGLKNGLDLETEKPLLELLEKTKIELLPTEKKNRVCTILLSGEDVTEKLFTPEISWDSSRVAIFPGVRKILVKRQQQIAKSQAVVLEGRDITYRVLPKADLKIYMTADVKVRAKRRWQDLKKQNIETSFRKVLNDTKKRDFQDSHRKADPLKIINDVWIIDTSKMTIKQELEIILKKLKEMKLIK